MILVVSDLHLSHRFKQSKYDLLARIIAEADRVIINGDLWDMYLTSWDRFVASRWSGLFPLLKSKRTIYLPGNHDPEDKIDYRWQLFADEYRETYACSVGSKKFIIQHGHRQSHSFEVRHPTFAAMTGSLYIVADWLMGRKARIARRFQMYMGQESSDRLIELKEFAASHPLKNTSYIFGHAHIAFKDDAIHCYIPGEFTHGLAHWLTISDRGVVTLHEEHYA
jgi:predicted phosphodiesterase